jgi:hypothetical protein
MTGRVSPSAATFNRSLPSCSLKAGLNGAGTGTNDYLSDGGGCCAGGGNSRRTALAGAASAATHGEGHNRSRRFRQFDWRCGIRRNPPRRPCCRVGAITFPEPAVGGRNPSDVADDGKPANAQLTPEVAREVCQRTSSAAALKGSIAVVGTRYNLILKAFNCASGDLLSGTEAPANDKSHVLDALGKVASEMRRKLGESLSTTQKYNMPLEQATTPSLEALQAYIA